MSRVILLAAAIALGALAGCMGAESAPEDAATQDAGDASPTRDRNATAEDDSGNATRENATSEDAGGGASNGTPAPSPQEDPSEGDTEAFQTWGCAETFSMTEVSKAWAARHTPEGFEPLTFFPPSALGVPAERTAKASFVVNSAHCDRVTLGEPGTDGPTVEDTDQFFYGVFVDPPEAYRTDGVKLYVYPFRFVVDSAPMADLMGNWTLPVEQGTVDLARHVDQGQRSWTVTGESDTVLRYRLDIEAAGEEQAWESEEVVRFFGAAENGTVTHAMDRRVQPNTTQSPLPGGASSFELLAPDTPSPTVPSPITNVKMTPEDKVAKEVRLVRFAAEAG